MKKNAATIAAEELDRRFDAADRRGDCVAVLPEGEEELPRPSGAPLPPKYPQLFGEIDPRFFTKPPKKRRDR